MPTWDTVREWVLSGLVQNFVWMLVAIFFAQFVQRAYEKWRYGNWRILVKRAGEELVNREISTGKVKEILSEPAEMSVFVKGVASPYGWINCDVLTIGKDNGLFVKNPIERRLVIDLDKNPGEEKSPKKRSEEQVKGKKRRSK